MKVDFNLLRDFYYSSSYRKNVETVRKVNPEIIKSFRSYILEGEKCDKFVKACITNDLIEAFAYADEERKEVLHEIAAYISTAFPEDAWGSEEAYRKVVSRDGYLQNLSTEEKVSWAELRGL